MGEILQLIGDFLLSIIFVFAVVYIMGIHYSTREILKILKKGGKI